jgi:hypothetical protein
MTRNYEGTNMTTLDTQNRFESSSHSLQKKRTLDYSKLVFSETLLSTTEG